MRQHKYTVKASTAAKVAAKRRQPVMSSRSKVFASNKSYDEAWEQVAAGIAKRMDRSHTHISDTSVRYVDQGPDSTIIRFDFNYQGRADTYSWWYPEGGWKGFAFDPTNIPGMIDYLTNYILDDILKEKAKEQRRLGKQKVKNDYNQEAFEDDVFDALPSLGAEVVDQSTQGEGRYGTYTFSYQGADYVVDASEVYAVLESSFEYGVDDNAVLETAQAIIDLF